jgi:glucuronoarabinoxylan endo-1,4-beta-xylanase
MKMKAMSTIALLFLSTIAFHVSASVITIAKSDTIIIDTTSKKGASIINLSAIKQKIRGFGGVNAWKGKLSDVDMNTLYGNANADQYGFSIYRVRIAPFGDTSWATELSNAKKAIARGAIVMATPWSPPAAMKTNNNVIGGSIKASSYADYAAYLKHFAEYMKDNGAKLYAISIQNEPDVHVKYESCDWSAAQMRDFLSGYGSAIGNTPIIAYESFNFNSRKMDTILDDKKAAKYVNIIGGHVYGKSNDHTGIGYYARGFNEGKEVWMTEHLVNNTDWKGALNTAKEMHDCMTVGNYSAYLWWFLKRFYGPIGEKGETTKRGYVMAQFSKYIRPGYNRVDASANPTTYVYISAYKGDGKVVIVAVNLGATDVGQQFNLSGGKVPSSFTPHITSENKNNSTEGNVKVADKGFTYSLPAKSVVTFVSN